MPQYVSKIQERKYLEELSALRLELCGNLQRIKSAWYDRDLSYYQQTFEFIKSCQQCQDTKACEENIQVPLTLSQTESAVAFLVQIFFARKNMFSVVGSPKIQDALDALEKRLYTNQRDFQWLANFIPLFRDIVKNNAGFLQTSWKSTPLSASLDTIFSTDGVEFRYLNPYLVDWDTTVPFERLSSEGLIISYTEFLSEFHLRRRLKKLGEKVTPRYRKAKFAKTKWQMLSPVVNISYASIYERAQSETDWEAHFSDLPDTWLSNSTIDSHKWEIVYARLADGKLHEFIIVDSVFIVSHEVLLHDSLPIIAGTGIVDAFDASAKSVISPLRKYQDVATRLIKAKLASARRAINDRGIFNPAYVATEHVNAKNSAAKIPIRPGKRDEPTAVQSAYRSIEYRDTMGQTYLQDAQLFMQSFPELATGISRFRQEPQRGNRSATEFSFLTDAADGRLKLIAFMLESGLMSQAKLHLKINYALQRPDSDKIPYAELLQEGFDFTLADGLISLGVLQDSQFLQNFTTAAAQIPELQPTVSAAYKYLLSINTSFNLSEFLPDQPPVSENPDATDSNANSAQANFQ